MIRIQYHIVGLNQKELETKDVVTFVGKELMVEHSALRVRVSINILSLYSVKKLKSYVTGIIFEYQNLNFNPLKMIKYHTESIFFIGWLINFYV